MNRVGVRELRQHASRYIERVRAGETIEVTMRGTVVARLVPPVADAWSDLIQGGNVRAPSASLLDADAVPSDVDVTTLLRRQRDVER